MKTISRILAAAAIGFAAMTMTTGCNVASPDAGQQSVLVDKPFFFGHGGVQEQPISTGRSYTWPSTSVVTVDMTPQQYEVKFQDLMSKDGIPLDFDAIMRLRITDSVALVKKYGTDGQWYERNVQAEFANRVRQAVRKHGMNETAIDTTAIESIDNEVTEQMTSYLKSANVPVELIKITVGKAIPPDAIKTQRIATAAEQQRIITEQQTKLAEDARAAAERARAEADNQYRETLNLSPQEFVDLQRIAMQKEACAAKGTTCTFIVGNATPVINTGR